MFCEQELSCCGSLDSGVFQRWAPTPDATSDEILTGIGRKVLVLLAYLANLLYLRTVRLPPPLLHITTLPHHNLLIQIQSHTTSFPTYNQSSCPTLLKRSRTRSRTSSTKTTTPPLPPLVLTITAIIITTTPEPLAVQLPQTLVLMTPI